MVAKMRVIKLWKMHFPRCEGAKEKRLVKGPPYITPRQLAVAANFPNQLSEQTL